MMQSGIETTSCVALQIITRGKFIFLRTWLLFNMVSGVDLVSIFFNPTALENYGLEFLNAFTVQNYSFDLKLFPTTLTSIIIQCRIQV